MRISDYPYGRITKILKKAVNWLNENRRRLEKTKCNGSFDYPYYWDMPKMISHRLSSDQVDWLQGEVNEWNFRMSEAEYNEMMNDQA
jgi:hypothetical protein